MLAILETKLNLVHSIKAAKYINPGWDVIHNLDEAPYGRILIVYDPNLILLSKVFDNSQIIHCHAKNIITSNTFYISVVYASNNKATRNSFLHDLPALRQDTHPWIIFGDFNCYNKLADRLGGNPLSLNEIQPLRSAVIESNLIDINTTGMRFSWNNKRRHGRRTYSKIDHAFGNNLALSKWPTLYNHLPPPLLSDHSPLIIHLTGRWHQKKIKFQIF